MPLHHSPGTLLWERLPWEAVLRAGCPKQRAQTTIKHAIPRAFLSTAPRRRRKATVMKRKMYEWLNGPGKAFEKPAEDSTNYLGAYDERGNLRRHSSEESTSTFKRERGRDLRPFPLNPYFNSESVLSEELREEVYQQVLQHDMDISAVSAAYGIDKRRVAAVVRLKTIEKRWIEEGKPIAKPYSDAVLRMLPLTIWRGPGSRVQHEPINDIPVHAATRNQLFYSASESRQFNRNDAAKAFSPTLLTADERMPHPEMVEIAKWKTEGISDAQRTERLKNMITEAREKKEETERKKKQYEEATVRVVPGRRWDFKFRNISVDSAGPDGMSPKGVGIRYGVPHDDRKRGQYKLPTRVE